MDMAAFTAPQGPVLKAGPRRDNALDCHAGLASGTTLALGGARRQFGRREVQSGHGIAPKQVTNGEHLKPDSALSGRRTTTTE